MIQSKVRIRMENNVVHMDDSDDMNIELVTIGHFHSCTNWYECFLSFKQQTKATPTTTNKYLYNNNNNDNNDNNANIV